MDMAKGDALGMVVLLEEVFEDGGLMLGVDGREAMGSGFGVVRSRVRQMGDGVHVVWWREADYEYNYPLFRETRARKAWEKVKVQLRCPAQQRSNNISSQLSGNPRHSTPSLRINTPKSKSLIPAHKASPEASCL